MSQWDFAVNFFVALFALIDPIGMVPFFAQATVGQSGRDRAQIAALISLFAVGFLAFFYFTGVSLLAFFGISIPAFRIAGGIILFIAGLEMVQGHQTTKEADAEEAGEGEPGGEGDAGGLSAGEGEEDGAAEESEPDAGGDAVDGGGVAEEDRREDDGLPGAEVQGGERLR